MSTTQEGKKECIFVLFEGFICCVWETACSLIYNIYTYILRHEVRSQPRCTYVWTTKTRHILNISRVSKYEFYEWVTYKFCAGTLFKPNQTEPNERNKLIWWSLCYSFTSRERTCKHTCIPNKNSFSFIQCKTFPMKCFNLKVISLRIAI